MRPRGISLLVLAAAVCAPLLSLAQNPAANTRPATLDIYVIDVEGGDSVLYVSPSGESLLMDVPHGGDTPRDIDRIMDAVHDAGLTKIDNVLITHWHGDHFSGVADLAARIPILHYYDHGPDLQGSPTVHQFVETTYKDLYSKAKHTVLKPGDKIPIAGLDWSIVTAKGEVIKTPLPGGGMPNPECAKFVPIDPADDGGIENPMSVGSVIAFGKFRMVHLGDLTWNMDFKLMCPNNPIGTVDVFVTSNHGLRIANSETLVHGLRPRVAIMNNGIRKGGEPALMKNLLTSPGLENLWEVHFSLLSGQEYTVPGLFIANILDDPMTTMPIAPLPPPADLYVLREPRSLPPPPHNGKAYWIKISAQSDGTFSVTNQRNGFTKVYPARSKMR